MNRIRNYGYVHDFILYSELGRDCMRSALVLCDRNIVEK